MGALAEIYIKKETLETILKTLETKSEKGISITLSLNDKSNEYGQNVSSFVSQNKEQREAKKEKFYVGNGKVFWSDGKITVADKNKTDTNDTKQDKSKDLPFQNMDEHLLSIIKHLQTAKETAKIEPSHILSVELWNEIKNALNRLYKDGRIKVGNTINDKYIKII